MTEKRSPEDVRVAIVLLRSLKGWSQARLAAQLGMSASTVSRWEKGETVPPDKLWNQIVMTVGLPPVWADRMLVLIRSSRAAIEDPSTASDPDSLLDAIAFQVADRVFKLVREAVAAILAELPHPPADGWWAEKGLEQEPS